MWALTRLQAALVRLTARRYRRILIASLVTLGTSVTLLGLIGLTHWRGRAAIQSDTRAVIVQAGQQLLRSLQSRRGTLTFLRDALKRQPDLTPAHLHALGTSAVQHTRHLLGIGLARTTQVPVWWSGPQGLAQTELTQLNRAIILRAKQRGIWRTPSTFVARLRTQRPLLVMMEPIRAAAHRERAVIGVFDLASLLGDFFTTTLAPRYPVQLLDGETLLYRSPGWQPAIPPPGAALQAPGGGTVVEQPVAIDAARWTLQMQPGTTRVTQTLSWLNVLLIILGVLAGLGITIIVWILAIRTWVLQRAVERRTVVLRRTLERVRQLAITDELTGVYNRRFFLRRWGWEYERAKRYQRPLICLMVDVNGFKQVNDRLGHHAGDLVLQQVAQELKAMLRESDILARFGGDEFIVALPETSEAQAEPVAEKLREIRITVPDGERHGLPAISLSVGIGRVDSDDEGPEATLEAADQSLYAWKRKHVRVPL